MAAPIAASMTEFDPHLDPDVLLFSYYRDAELRGSNLLYRLLRVLVDPESQTLLSEHLADETRHAWLWTERIKELGGHPVAITDGYQVRIGKEIGFPRRPLELLTLTVVVEQRALRRYQEHLKRDDISPRTREILQAVSKDEGWHIDWIRKKAKEVAAEQGRPERYDELIAKYREVDRKVMEEIDEAERKWMAAAA